MFILVSPNNPRIIVSKCSNFFGQSIYGQLIKSLDREKIVEMSRKYGGERYVKSFDGYKLPQKGVLFVLSMYKYLARELRCVIYLNTKARNK